MGLSLVPTHFVFVLLAATALNGCRYAASGAEPSSATPASEAVAESEPDSAAHPQPQQSPPGQAEEDETKPPPTAAFIDLDRSPLGLLLETRLLANPAAVWLERNEIDAIQQEQKLAEVMSAKAGPRRIALGRLLKADVLILLRTEKSKEGNRAELVVAETRGGLRLVSRSVMVASGSEAGVDLLEGFVERGIEKSTMTIDQVYAVPPFFSRDLSFEYSYLKNAYADFLEQRLSSLPGVLVVELDEANAIAEEYRTADPAGIIRRPLPLYVVGEYRNEGSGGNRRTTIKLCVKRGEETLAEREETLIPWQVTGFLWDQVCTAVREDGRPALSSDVTVEARELEDRARQFFQVGDWSETLALAEASLLLCPQQPDVLRLAADAAARLRKPAGSADTLSATVAALGYQRRAFEHFRALRACQPDLEAMHSAWARQLPICTVSRSWIYSSVWPEEIEGPYRALAADWRDLLLDLAHEFARAGSWQRSMFILKYAPPGRDAKQDYADKLRLVLACQNDAEAGDLMKSFCSKNVDSFENREFLSQLKASQLASPELRKEAEDRLQEFENQHRPRDLVKPPPPTAPPPRPSAPAAPPKPASGDIDSPSGTPDGPQECVVFSPASIYWTDDDGKRKLLGSGDGFLPLDNGMDLLWETCAAVYVIQEKGLARRVWKPSPVIGGRKRDPLAMLNARIRSVDFDGRYVWITVEWVGEVPEVWVLDPHNGKTWQITVAHGLPLHGRPDKRGWYATALAAGVGPGEAIIAGYFGPMWLAKVKFDPGGNHQVEVFHEAREITDGREPANELSSHFAVRPTNMLVMSNPDASEKRVVVFRGYLLALVVDPQTLTVEVSDRIRDLRVEDDFFFQGAWYYRNARFKFDPVQPGVYCRRSPVGEPTLVVEGPTPAGRLFVYGTDVHIVSDRAWYRARLKSGEPARFERLPHVVVSDDADLRTQLRLPGYMPRRSNLYGIRLGMYEASFETRVIEAPPTAGGEVHVAENATPGNRSSGTPATTNKPPPFVPPSQDLLPVESVAANERNPVDCVREALALAVSPDSSRFATLALRRHVGRNDETEIVLWSTQELQPLRTASSLPAEFRDIEFSPDGTQLMCAGRVHVWFWDLKSGAHTVGLHAGYARPISAERVFFCPNGRQIVAKGVADGPVRLWDFATGNGIVVETLANIGGFLPEGSLVGVAASIPRKLVAWNLEDHSYRTLCEPLAGVPVALSPYGDRLVTEERVALLGGNCKDVRHVRLWDLKSAREIPIGGPQPQAVEPFYSRRLNDHMALGVSIQWDGRNIRFAPRYELTPRREQAQRPRDWAAHNLASSCRAAMIAYGHGKVTLRKDGGEEVTVPVEQLTAMDRRFVQEFADSLGESVEP